MINARVDLIAAIKKLAEEMTYTIKDYEDEDGDTGIKWAAIAEDFIGARRPFLCFWRLSKRNKNKLPA